MTNNNQVENSPVATKSKAPLFGYMMYFLLITLGINVFATYILETFSIINLHDDPLNAKRFGYALGYSIASLLVGWIVLIASRKNLKSGFKAALVISILFSVSLVIGNVLTELRFPKNAEAIKTLEPVDDGRGVVMAKAAGEIDIMCEMSRHVTEKYCPDIKYSERVNEVCGTGVLDLIQEPYKSRFVGFMSSEKYKATIAAGIVKADQEYAKLPDPVATICGGSALIINNSVEANYAKITQYK